MVDGSSQISSDTEAPREAMAAYQTRWEAVAAIEAEELRSLPIERLLREYVMLVTMAHVLGTFAAAVAYNEADVQPVRSRWVRFKENAA